MDYSLADQIPEDDDRQSLWAEQRSIRGFDDTELWNLDMTIAKFIYPRLVAFKGIMPQERVNKMIAAFALLIDDTKCYYSEEEQKIIDLGLNEFVYNFTGLWN